MLSSYVDVFGVSDTRGCFPLRISYCFCLPAYFISQISRASRKYSLFRTPDGEQAQARKSYIYVQINISYLNTITLRVSQDRLLRLRVYLINTSEVPVRQKISKRIAYDSFWRPAKRPEHIWILASIIMFQSTEEIMFTT